MSALRTPMIGIQDVKLSREPAPGLPPAMAALRNRRLRLGVKTRSIGAADTLTKAETQLIRSEEIVA
ncbi:MAG: hypothetical protein AAGA73_10035 [Pseudomonadota bacterium]